MIKCKQGVCAHITLIKIVYNLYSSLQSELHHQDWYIEVKRGGAKC